MEIEIASWLSDIKQAINEINEFLPDRKEFLVFQKNNLKENFLAKRFAAKEAFAKALGTGFRGDVNVKSIVVINNELGRPDIKLNKNVARLLKEKKIKSCHLSISDEKNIAAAFVVLESE